MQDGVADHFVSGPFQNLDLLDFMLNLAMHSPSPLLTGLFSLSACVAAATANAESVGDFERATGLFERGEYAESARLLQSCVKASPEKAICWFDLGASLLAQGNAREAIPAFEKTVALKSPLARAARFYWAKSEEAAGLGDSAWDRLDALSQEPLLPGLAAQVAAEQAALRQKLFASAQSSFQAGRFEAAKKDLETIRAHSRAQDAQAEFLLALTLLKLKERSSADLLLEKLTQTRGDSDLSSWARTLLSPTPDTRAFSLRGELGGGYDTNVYQASGTTGTTSAPLATASLDLRATLWHDGETAWVAHLFPQWLETVGIPDNRILRGIASLAWDHELGDGARLEIAPLVEYQILGAQPYLFQPGGSAALSIPVAEREWFGLSASYQHDFAEDPSYSYLAGDSLLALATLTYQQDSGWLEISGGYRLENDQDYTYGTAVYPLAYSAPVIRARAVIALGDRVRLAPSADFELRLYPTLARPENEARTDYFTELGLRLSYVWPSGFELFVAGTQDLNYSSLGQSLINGSYTLDRGYQETRALAGISWEVGS
jgi:thioredoxin-like negative regulator of GroEL